MEEANGWMGTGKGLRFVSCSDGKSDGPLRAIKQKSL